MAHLTKPVKYDIKDSNIALLGSDLEKKVREHAGDKEKAWTEAGIQPGLQIWRIEKFTVVHWPSDRSFYDGDSYIILHSYKKTPEAAALSFDLHFWLGENTTQDEAGTAAFKTVELDDHLGGHPVQYREVQGYESSRFLSYFPRFICLHGGVSTGFHHVSSRPPQNLRRLYKISLSRQAGGRSHLQIREVLAEGTSLEEGHVFVLDKGPEIFQLNTNKSVGQEKFKAAEFVHSLVNDREGQSEVKVFDEGGHGAGIFLAEFGLNSVPSQLQADQAKPPSGTLPTLYRLSDSSGDVIFEPVELVAVSSLSSSDAFLLDHSLSPTHPTVYIWIGKSASLMEQRLALQYAQTYAHKIQSKAGHSKASISLMKMNEGHEPDTFIHAFDG